MMEMLYADQDVLFRLLRGCLVGTAVGDSLGLPAENLSEGTVRRRWKGRWKQGFLFKYGMVSDDTEHSVLLGRALMKHPRDVAAHLARFAMGREVSPLPSIEDWAAIGGEDADWQRLMEAMRVSRGKGDPVQEFACSLGLRKGVSGYMYHTVPVCLYALLRHEGDFKGGMEAVLNLGGDTDTTGAIYGALAGMRGEVPDEWVKGIKDFPVSIAFLEELARGLAQAAATGEAVMPRRFPWYANALFLVVVFVHCFRRIIPC